MMSAWRRALAQPYLVHTTGVVALLTNPALGGVFAGAGNIGFVLVPLFVRSKSELYFSTFRQDIGCSELNVEDEAIFHRAASSGTGNNASLPHLLQRLHNVFSRPLIRKPAY